MLANIVGLKMCFVTENPKYLHLYVPIFGYNTFNMLKYRECAQIVDLSTEAKSIK